MSTEYQPATSAEEAVAARLGRLAEDQRGAATAAAGPVLCVAPAGSGKTTTVVARVAWRILDGTDPSTICALTFNRRAAIELRERIDGALTEMDVTPGSVRVRTFHGLGRDILEDAGFDVTRIVEREPTLSALADGQLTKDGLRWLDEAFTRLKLDPDRGPPAADIATHAAFAAYRQRLAALDAIDLDDLVALPPSVLEADPALLARWRRSCSTLFVDEAQDLDRSQLELALVLAGERRDIFLVGDDDQTIYAWRLADVRRVLGLAQRLPGLRRVDLRTNHRSAPEIVARAVRLVEHNRERFEKEIRASPRSTGEVRLAPDTGDAVARARRLLTTWAGADVGSHAVLARTNRELAPYAAAAIEASLAYEIVDDGLLLQDDAVARLIQRAGLEDMPAEPLLAINHAARETDAPAATMQAVAGWAAAYGDMPTFRSAWLEARNPARDARGSGITLATVHGTKGLEWDHVACIGFDAGSFPSARSMAEATDPARALEEERRLAYVAWTRARTSLTIVYDPWAPSRFITEAFDADEIA